MASSCKEWPKEATTHHSSVSRASSVVSSNPGTPISLVCQVKSRVFGAIPPQGYMCREATRHITADPEYIPAWKREQKLSSACMYQECSLPLPTLSPAPKKGKGRQRESLYQECSASSQNEKLITTSTESLVSRRAVHLCTTHYHTQIKECTGPTTYNTSTTVLLMNIQCLMAETPAMRFCQAKGRNRGVLVKFCLERLL